MSCLLDLVVDVRGALLPLNSWQGEDLYHNRKDKF